MTNEQPIYFEANDLPSVGCETCDTRFIKTICDFWFLGFHIVIERLTTASEQKMKWYKSRERRKLLRPLKLK